MEKGEARGGFGGAHVILLPFGAQGHINPIFQFAQHITSRGVKATLLTNPSESLKAKAGDVGIEFISGFEPSGTFRSEGGAPTATRERKSKGFTTDMFRETASQALEELINNYAKSSSPVTCLVYDSICPWALDIAKDHGLVGAVFFTQSCSVCSIFYHAHKGVLTVPVEGSTVSLPQLPQLSPQDLPTVLHTNPPHRAVYVLLQQFSNVDKVDWLLFNSFDKLESEVVKMMKEIWPVKTIGPTALPNICWDNKPSDHEAPCFKWLDSKENGSVIYVSFGSVAALNEEQMEEIALGIRQSKKYFLWVVLETEQNNLPSNFIEEVSEQGLVVSWCSQAEVLAHKAIGCFITHCGWNSIIEALSLGVSMVAMPQLWDQVTNAKFVEDVWEVGVRAKKDEKGVIRKEELEQRIREVMDGEKGKVIKNNSEKWRKLAIEAKDKGGSSDVNINEFVASLI